MKYISLVTIKNLALMSFVIGLASGCGGGSDSDSPESEVPALGFALVSGKVLDGDGSPIAGAQVRVPFGDNAAWGAETEPSGAFSFQLKASDYAGVTPVAMTIEKTGYRTRAVTYRSIADGAHYTVPDDASNALLALKEGEYAPALQASIIHIGNDRFGGSVNSQLQLKSIGDGIVTPPFASINPELRGKYSRIRLEFIARGVDGTGSCQNQIGFGVGNSLITSRPSPSNISGDYTAYGLEYELPAISEDTEIRFFARSGMCTTDDIDDFEFTSVFVKLVP